MNSKDLMVQTSQLERRSNYQVGQLMPAQDEWVRLLFTQMPIDESTLANYATDPFSCIPNGTGLLVTLLSW
jgi:hypothetical protein